MSEQTFHKTVCTGCGVNVEYPTAAEGKTVSCPNCGNYIILPKIYPTLPKSSYSENTQELKAPKFVDEPKDARTTEGEYVFFRAKAEGVPDPAYQWFSVDRDNNGQVLPGETRSELLVINPPIGTTRYVVQASNSVGDVQSRVATLCVEKRSAIVQQAKIQEDIELQRRRLEGGKEQAKISASQNTKSHEEKNNKEENGWSWNEICAFIFISWCGLCGAVTFASKIGKIGDYTNAQWNIWPKMAVWADALLAGGLLLCLVLSVDFGKKKRSALLGIGSCLLLIVIVIKYYPSFYPLPNQNQTAFNPAAPDPQDLKSKAESGDAIAQFTLGMEYFNGDGVAKDEAEAVYWWRKAAEQNFPRAQYSLGACYYNGQGVTKDEVEAATWWRKAAEQKNPDAQCGLGVCYFNGQGVEKSAEQAVEWYRKAAEQDNTLAQTRLGYCYANGQGVSMNWEVASNWLQLASDKGNSDATKLLIARKNMEMALQADEDRIVNGDPSFQATVVSTPDTPQVTATNVTAKVTESNASWWKWTWKLTLVNNGSDSVNVNTAVQFFDNDGYLVDEDKYGVQNAALPAYSSQTFTGLKMIILPATKNVASVGAKVDIQ